MGLIFLGSASFFLDKNVCHTLLGGANNILPYYLKKRGDISLMSLFKKGTFHLHSGGVSNYKIDCSALSDEDLATIALFIVKHCLKSGVSFYDVYGIPTGGTRLAEALKPYCEKNGDTLLIVDDVFTTGRSIEEAILKHRDRNVYCVVIFARDDNKIPFWVKPLFKMWG